MALAGLCLLAPLAPISRVAEYCQGARFGFRRPCTCCSAYCASGRLHQMPKDTPRVHHKSHTPPKHPLRFRALTLYDATLTLPDSNCSDPTRPKLSLIHICSLETGGQSPRNRCKTPVCALLPASRFSSARSTCSTRLKSPRRSLRTLGTRFARLGSLRIASPACAAVTRLCVSALEMNCHCRTYEVEYGIMCANRTQ